MNKAIEKKRTEFQQNKEKESADAVSSFDEQLRGFEMIFDLDITRDAELEIVVDQNVKRVYLGNKFIL